MISRKHFCISVGKSQHLYLYGTFSCFGFIPYKHGELLPSVSSWAILGPYWEKLCMCEGSHS